MITIRLSRIGKRGQPQYRMVVQDSHRDPWSPAIEVVGLFDPRSNPPRIELQAERIGEWLSKGAQPSSTVHNMLVDAKIIDAKKQKTVTISKKRKAAIDAKKAEAEAKAPVAA
ncbi:MAG: 30S ribosomal protein S16 [Patescibacteria group bacterium]|jgi:small subunit ribosomal protein S16